MSDETFARRGDPWTSWAAAASVDNLSLRRQAVVFLLTTYGPMTDTEIRMRYHEHPELPQQSVSGLRTRRSELVDEDRVHDSGKTVTLESGRHSIVWTVDDPDAPTTTEEIASQPTLFDLSVPEHERPVRVGRHKP